MSRTESLNGGALDVSRKQRAAVSRGGTALLEALTVYGFVGWVYVAVVAVVHPDRLAEPVVSWLPVRLDTFGIVGFAVSAGCYAPLAYLSGAGPIRMRGGVGGDLVERSNGAPPVARRAIIALLRTAHLYSSAVWLYLTGNSLSHPETLPMQLTHLTPWPTEGGTAAACFLASMATFYALRWQVHGIAVSQKGSQ